MRRCLQSARLGEGTVAPNPMVGAVLVQQGRILAEGWHRAYGGPHAEAECLRAFGTGPVPTDAVMYVSLEPCAHHGRTPPCADLLVQRGVKHVVVGCGDPDPRVAGGGIARLRAAGVQVVEDVLREESRWCNRRFITSIEKKRPYVVLKWARSLDGLLDQHPREGRGVQRISSFPTNLAVHRWRATEQAIMVGSRTVVNDDPQLTVRLVAGRQPLRIVLDRKNLAPAASHVFDNSAPTLLFTASPRTDVGVEQNTVPVDAEPLEHVLHVLQQRGIRSILVEGGAQLLGQFLAAGLWDEAREITGTARFIHGTPAPRMQQQPVHTAIIGGDRVDRYLRQPADYGGWPW